MTKITSFHDPVRDEFQNKILQWNGSDTKDRFLKSGNRLFSESDISYRMNSYGFRCDEFDSQSTTPTIAYIGCSVTEGIGLPSDKTWPYVLHENIRQRNPNTHLPYYNLGMGGASMDHISRMVTQVWPILQPRIAFAHFPDPYRREVAYDGHRYQWMSNMTYEDKFGTARLLIDDTYVTYQTEKNLSLMQEYFSKYNTVCLYTYWTNAPESETTIKYDRILMQERYPNFKKIDTIFYYYPDTARDNMHPGLIANSNHANNVSKLTRDVVDEILSCNK